MEYKEFIQEVVKKGIEAVKRDYKRPDQKAIRKGSIAGFEACIDKEPLELLALLEKASKKTGKLMLKLRGKGNNDKYWEARGFELEVEWVCNCVSCLEYNEHKPTIITPTVRGMIAVSKIVGVNEESNVQTKPAEPDKHGHKWDDEDLPTLDDDGELSCYARCSRCGAVENTDESILKCPGVMTYKDSNGN
jgi:hypothetical protein